MIAVLVVVIAALIVVLVRRKPKDDVEKVTSEEAIQTETEATPETASDATEAATTEAATKAVGPGSRETTAASQFSPENSIQEENTGGPGAMIVPAA